MSKKSNKNFNTIATVIKTTREVKNISQALLSKSIGYKNAQFISNVERGLCSIPAKKVKVVAEVLGIEIDEVVSAMVADYKESIRNNM